LPGSASTSGSPAQFCGFCGGWRGGRRSRKLLPGSWQLLSAPRREAPSPQGSLNTYRFCDNVWTFVLNDVEFREVTELIKVDKVKIVACDGKNTGSNTTE
uniref:Ral transcription factor IIA subunit 2 n=1 Tax=Pongo abelii TaxID=9601 RepID=A0A8I5TL17_PONAB